MIVDKREHIRELDFRRIIKARYLASKRKSIRSFQPPKINFLATDYTEIIHWNTTTLSPPPLLRKFTNQEISFKTQIRWNFGKFPCHTQAVKQCVKLVTKASQKFIGSNSRDGFNRTTLLSSKSNFKVPKETEGR
ncbi:hypothetical protein AVEN_272099-1 [Araneus ventricosus]|uniref:Uncharacterized protein n=1 Tax=Araneus ventricosus TaxID=182803 RepID=A0A4Y2N8G3_ARAVE|nr:hypothetical protein AVEN_272099-1 [Araneus ventricosus]